MRFLVFLSTIFLLATTPLFSATALHIMGGDNHDVYLGCLNCSDYDSNSIWNEYGTYGNSYSSNSIWNEYGTYGNEYSSNSPVLVDADGNFYGYFTTNEYRAQRANSTLVNTICEYYELIREDVDGWYKKLFG